MKTTENHELHEPDPFPCEDLRTGLSAECIARALVDNLFYVQGRLPESASKTEWYMTWTDSDVPKGPTEVYESRVTCK